MRELVDLLRALAQQPLAPHGRQRLAVAMIGLIAAAAVLMTALRPDAPSSRPPSERADVIDAAMATPTPTFDPAELPVPDDPERDFAEPAELRAGKQAARRFLASYLPYANGRGDAAQLTHLSEELREEFAENPPRRASTWDPDRPPPRIQHVQVTGSSARRMGILVLAVDGDLPISFELELARYDSGWLVTGTG
jgi:hypothetical protein